MWLAAINFRKSISEIVVIQMAFMYPKMFVIDMKNILPFFFILVNCLISFYDSNPHSITYFHILILVLWALIHDFSLHFSSFIPLTL